MVWGVYLCREARPPNFANAKVRKKTETTKFATLRIVKASVISVLATPFLLYGAGKRHECPGFNETLMSISFHQTLTPYWKNRSMLLHFQEESIAFIAKKRSMLLQFWWIYYLGGLLNPSRLWLHNLKKWISSNRCKVRPATLRKR